MSLIRAKDAEMEATLSSPAGTVVSPIGTPVPKVSLGNSGGVSNGPLFYGSSETLDDEDGDEYNEMEEDREEKGGGKRAAMENWHGNSHPSTVSDRVHNLASSIYAEFEAMIGRYGESVVENLMPIIVGMLEGMDHLYQERHSLEIELELVREDQAQVVLQYDREKTMRKSTEEKILKFEDEQEEENKQFEEKIESLESLVRIMELKARNAQDHATRLEEKEIEQKREFAQLHDRYTELFRSHMDYIERTKMATLQQQEVGDVAMINSRRRRNTSEEEENDEEGLREKLNNWDVGPVIVEDTDESQIPSIRNPPSNLEDFEDNLAGLEASLNTAPFQESSGEFEEFLPNADDQISFDEYGEAGLEMDPPVDSVWSRGMGKEIENLIKENSELIETKHALNIVKDDLIVKVDDLTGENMMLREELNSVNLLKGRLKEQVSESEKDRKEMQSQLEKLRRRLKELEEDEEEEITGEDAPTGLEAAILKTRFTRREMARVLHERNLYKERLMELQEAVRWTEKMRAEQRDRKRAQDSSGVINDLSVGLQGWILPGPEPAPPPTMASDLSSFPPMATTGRPETAVVIGGLQQQTQPASQRTSSVWNFFSNLITTAANTLADELIEPEVAVVNPPSSTPLSLRGVHPKPGSAQRLVSLTTNTAATSTASSANKKRSTTVPTNPLLSQSESGLPASTQPTVKLVPCEVTLLPVTSQPGSPE